MKHLVEDKKYHLKTSASLLCFGVVNFQSHPKAFLEEGRFVPFDFWKTEFVVDLNYMNPANDTRH